MVERSIKTHSWYGANVWNVSDCGWFQCTYVCINNHYIKIHFGKELKKKSFRLYCCWIDLKIVLLFGPGTSKLKSQLVLSTKIGWAFLEGEKIYNIHTHLHGVSTHQQSAKFCFIYSSIVLCILPIVLYGLVVCIDLFNETSFSILLSSN